MDTKILNGQFFTTTNPFTLKPFVNWVRQIPVSIKDTTILEPFAGSNNIPAMLASLTLFGNSWACFDIDPPLQNNLPSCQVIQRDTIADFPKGYFVTVTNPPYLGKTSAATKKLPFPDTPYDDLYKLCLEKLLQNVKYVAAIIPETFIISGQFTERLTTVISLTCKMFDDTKCPVCLALFNPEETADFDIYRMNEFLGTNSSLSKFIPKPMFKHSWKINDPTGIVGIKCVDSNDGPTIRFCFGEEIDSSKIKTSSRSETRVSGNISEEHLQIFIDKCNQILEEYRDLTKDTFLAPFKNLRKDGKYRRRLDFTTAKLIMSKAVELLPRAAFPMEADDEFECIDLFSGLL